MSDDIKKPWIKATLKEIKNIINNITFLVQQPEKGEPMNPCMDVYKAKNQSDGSLDKLKLRMVHIGGMKNKELVGDMWSPTSSLRTLKYLFADSSKHKSRVHQFNFIGSFLQAKVKNRIFVKLDSRYADYSPE